jgi:hypothetical protein
MNDAAAYDQPIDFGNDDDLDPWPFDDEGKELSDS